MARLKIPKIGLKVSIGLAFTLSLVTILLFLISVSYSTNSKNLYALTESYSERSSRDTMAAVESLLAPVASALRITAEMAVIDPAFFTSERSRDFLQKAVSSADQIDAIYTSFEDGYHRVVTRVDADRRRNDPQIPFNAKWHSSFIDKDGATGPKRYRHRTFFEAWPVPIKRYDVESLIDVRALPPYIGTKAKLGLFLADPLINADTGAPVIALGYPIIRQGRFIGFAAAHITFNILGKYLNDHRLSPNSVTMILDAAGQVIAHPDPKKGVKKDGDKVLFARVDSFPDEAVREAVRRRKLDGKGRQLYVAGDPPAEYLAAFSPFPDSFGKPWEVLTVTPTDDFLGALKAANRRLSLMMSALVVFQFLLILALAKWLADPIDRLSTEMQGLRTLSFSPPRDRGSPIREVDRLGGAFTLLQNSLKSFSAFVPIGVVRQLIDSGKPLGVEVESKELTILFTDLENFTTICERISPEDVSGQLTSYFERTTTAITTEGGTIDKFIGDAVMAFWGAPAPVEDQVAKACAGALRVAHRIKSLNAQWAKEGKLRMDVRIGLHRGRALVGTLGSSDRLSYTAIGDAVNVAARLEGVNKQYGSTICISADVYDAVGDRVIVKPLGEVTVKGRLKPLQVYELVGMRDRRDSELLG